MSYETYEVRVRDNGGQSWYDKNGRSHREDGPAIEYTDGTKFWYLNGQLHREDGPAEEWANGSKGWYLNGEALSETEHALRVADNG